VKWLHPTTSSTAIGITFFADFKSNIALPVNLLRASRIASIPKKKFYADLKTLEH
jgi:hypothetical protein